MMVVHELHDTDHAAVRAEYPDAAIIRRMDRGHYFVFDRAEDAMGHSSTAVQSQQQQRAA